MERKGNDKIKELSKKTSTRTLCGKQTNNCGQHGSFQHKRFKKNKNIYKTTMWKNTVESVESPSVKNVDIEIFSRIKNPSLKPVSPFFI